MLFKGIFSSMTHLIDSYSHHSKEKPQTKHTLFHSVTFATLHNHCSHESYNEIQSSSISIYFTYDITTHITPDSIYLVRTCYSFFVFSDTIYERNKGWSIFRQLEQETVLNFSGEKRPYRKLTRTTLNFLLRFYNKRVSK